MCCFVWDWTATFCKRKILVNIFGFSRFFWPGQNKCMTDCWRFKDVLMACGDSTTTVLPSITLPVMFVLQAHLSWCSLQVPTWPCLLSSHTATATQQHQAMASRHSPASVIACEQPQPLTTWPAAFLSPLLFFVFLTSFPWSSTHNRGHKQATAHSYIEYLFYYVGLLQQQGTLQFRCLKWNWTLLVFHIPC